MHLKVGLLHTIHVNIYEKKTKKIKDYKYFLHNLITHNRIIIYHIYIHIYIYMYIYILYIYTYYIHIYI